MNLAYLETAIPILSKTGDPRVLCFSDFVLLTQQKQIETEQLLQITL